MQKLYCYVDETGQDARSKFFLVSVVIAEDDREEFLKELTRIEKESGKGRRKWMDARDQQRVAYMQLLFANSLFKGKLCYAVYPRTPDYFTKTIVTVAHAITAYVTTEDYRATVLIDGLPKSLISQAAVALRRLRIKIFKVRGIRKEENDALMRLADAMCGFVRSASEGREAFAKLLEKAKKQDFLREL